MPDSCYDRLTFEEHVKLEFHYHFRREKAHFLKQFLPQTDAKFLDVGCGSGFDLHHMAHSLSESGSRGVMLVGVDLSRNMLQQARQYLGNGGQRTHLVQADALALPFCDNVFDLVHSHGLSVFGQGSVQDRTKVLGEQRRTCKPSGTIVTVLPQRDQEGFLPTGEPQMRFLYRGANIRFLQAVYSLGKLPRFGTVTLLAFLHKILPRPVSRRLLKSPEEYLCQEAFMIVAVGKKETKAESENQ